LALGQFKNKIINGNFDIWQRGTSFSAPTADDYTADRWVIEFDGTGGTEAITRQSFTLGQTDVPNEPQYYLNITQSVAKSSGSYHLLSQRIEGVRIFAGETVTLKLYMRANDAAETLPYIRVQQNFGTGGSPSASVNTNFDTSIALAQDVWEELSFTIDIPSISGKTLGTAGDYLALQICFPDDEAFDIDIAQVQLEKGSTATDFETRHIGQELAMCQRYYIRATDILRNRAHKTGLYNVHISVFFPTYMRTKPTFTVYPTTIGIDGGYMKNATADTNVTTDIKSVCALSAVVRNWDSVTDDDELHFKYTADAEL